MTNKEKFAMVIEAIKGNENEAMLKEFLENEIAKIEKREASAEKRKAQKLEANAEMEAKILEIMLDVNQIVTVKEIANELGVSFQKITPRMTALLNTGKVKRTTQGKNIYWALA